MPKIIFSVTVSAFLVSASFVYAQTTASTPNISYEDIVCKDHGGVNCSIINPDGSPTCNDGFNDKDFFIYAVSYCKDTLDQLTEEQSELMAKTGCYPPSEMTCINNDSYTNLSKHLSSLGLINSELGKNELLLCRQEITEYSRLKADYELCLKENKIGPFLPLGEKMILPIMKSVFCPIFYGKYSTYNPKLDLCLCDDGYFRNGEICVEASSICKSKYGNSFYAQDGNCVSSSKTTRSSQLSTTSILTSPTPQMGNETTALGENPDMQYGYLNEPPSRYADWEPPDFDPAYQDKTPVKPISLAPLSPFNILKNIFVSIVSGIMNILR